MSYLHQKKLLSYQKQMKKIQEKLQKAEQDLGIILLNALQNKQALSLDMDTLIGGFFHVIDQINQGDSQVEKWNKVGKTYFKKSAKSSALEDKK